MSSAAGQRPKLTMAQIDEIKHRMELRRANSPKRIAADMGCGVDLIRQISRGYLPKRYGGRR